MIESVEFHFANPARKLTRGRKGSGGQGRNHRHIHHFHVAALRNHISAAVDHDRELRFGLFQKISEHAVQRRHVLDCQNRDRVHAGSFCVSDLVGSTGIATGNAAPWGASLCLLNLCNRTCETAFSAAKTFCPLLEITSKLCSRFFRLLSTYSM